MEDDFQIDEFPIDENSQFNPNIVEKNDMVVVTRIKEVRSLSIHTNNIRLKTKLD